MVLASGSMGRRKEAWEEKDKCLYQTWWGLGAGLVFARVAGRKLQFSFG